MTTWTYQISTGALLKNGIQIGIGYSGNGPGLNNVTEESHIGVGPIPEGKYIIGTFVTLPHLGPCVAPLLPASTNSMYGRSGFYIHGDNAELNHSGSDGCIILSLPLREQIRDSGKHQLLIVS